MRRDDILRLKEQRKHLHNEMIELAGAAEGEERDLTAEETEQFEKMEGEFRSLGDRIERGEKLIQEAAEVQRQLDTPVSEFGPGEDGEVPLSLAEYRKQKLGDRPWNTPEYRSAYWKYLTVRSTAELEIEEQRVLSKASGAVGLYLVPTDMYDQIIRSIRFMGSVGQLATTVTTASGDVLNVPTNPTHGTASWTAESGAYTPSDETFGTAQLNAFKAAAKIIVSEELITDSAFPLDGFLATEFGERIGVLENTGFIAGTGTGQPQGMVGNISNVQAATGNATSFTYTALVTALFTIPPQYRSNAVFIVADGAARNLYLMLDGQSRPLWNVNVATSGPDTFLGYPIYTDPDLATPAASAKSIIFGDVKRAYIIRRVDGFSMQRQNELHSDSGQIGFRGYERVDGRVVLAAAATTIQHSAT